MVRINKVQKLLHSYLLLLLLHLVLVPEAVARPESSEYEVKARYIYHFPKFTRWPDKEYSKKVLCTIGRDPFNGYLDKVDANKRMTVYRNISLDEVDKCNTLFISLSEEDQLDRILRKVENKPILTVSEIKGFYAKGGIIGLIMVKEKVRFEVNYKQALEQGLMLDVRLANLAENTIR